VSRGEAQEQPLKLLARIIEMQREFEANPSDDSAEANQLLDQLFKFSPSDLRAQAAANAELRTRLERAEGELRELRGEAPEHGELPAGSLVRVLSSAAAHAVPPIQAMIGQICEVERLTGSGMYAVWQPDKACAWAFWRSDLALVSLPPVVQP